MSLAFQYFRQLSVAAITILAVLVFITPQDSLADPKPRSGLFLVATEKLDKSRFRETVILLTHYSPRGTTGLTINRPTEIPLSQAFPHIQQLHDNEEPLFLGGPVKTNAIFVLVHTLEPNQGMHLISDNLYFSTGKNAFGFPLKGTARTYAGYASWAPGQLQHEISRGYWKVVKADPDIVFDKNLSGLWLRLRNRWSGNWI